MRQLKISPQITSRESLSVDKYLQDISKYSLVTAEQEVELAVKIKQGDEKALEKLVNANLRFVVSVAKKYQNMGLPLSDIISLGNIGLVKAAQRFDETKGFKFISYAVWWIRQTILQALSEQTRMVRLPLNQTNAMSRINKAFSKLEQEHEREPSVHELSAELNETVEKISQTLKTSGRSISLDKPVREGEDLKVGDLYANENSPSTDNELMEESLQIELERSLSVLSTQEREVLELYFGIGQSYSFSLKDIAERFSLTQERVRQIREKALNRLRSKSRNRLLRQYL